MRRPPVTDALIAATPAGEIVFWSRGAQQTFGYSASDMVGKPLSTIVRLPRLHAGGAFRVDATRKGGQTFRAGVVVEPFDDVMSIVIRDESRWSVLADFAEVVSQHSSFSAAAPRVAELIGRAYGFGAVATWNRLLDEAPVEGHHERSMIDELTRLAELARRFIRRERFIGAHELSDAGVFEGTHASDNLYRILGLPPQSRPITLRYFLRCVVDTDRQRLHDAIALARKNGSLDVRVRIRRDGGETRFLRLQAKRDGPRLLGSVTDVTDEQRETRRLSGLGHLAATMAHEFKNVLMGIGTFAEVVRRRTAGEVQVQNAVAQIQQSLGRGRRITDEVLRFTREPAPVMAPVDVRRWLSDFLPEAAALTGDRAEVAVEGEPLIRGDIALLNQVLANLIINARDAAPAGPIRMIARPILDACVDPTMAERVELIVADRGSGIAPELRDRIFEPLFTTKRGGTGLGLAVVQQVVTAHGGTVEVESEAGRGTEVHLRFPRFRGESATAEPRRISRVLLVEDDPAVTLALCAVLEAEEIDVRTATNGAAAINAIVRQVPQVVLLDIGLPDVSGADVYGEIAMRWPNLPVVFITAELDDTAVARFLRRPHIGFLRKPFEAEQLLDTLSRITSVKRRSESGRTSESGRRAG